MDSVVVTSTRHNFHDWDKQQLTVWQTRENGVSSSSLNSCRAQTELVGLHTSVTDQLNSATSSRKCPKLKPCRDPNTKQVHITQFIRTKHNMRIFGLIPLSSYKTILKQQLNGEKRWQLWRRANPLISLGVSYVRCLNIWNLAFLTVCPAQSSQSQSDSNCPEKPAKRGIVTWRSCCRVAVYRCISCCNPVSYTKTSVLW